MKDNDGRAILILGMHRSGTSYLARLMQSLGVFIGDELVGPKRGNPRGHFEAVPMLEFHQALIAARQSGRRRAFDDGMLVQEALPSPLSEEERAEANSRIEDMRRDGPWGWKEPRTCLFLDVWQELLEKPAKVVVYRHPLEVHQSLLRREHWDLALFPDQAIKSYCVYNQAILSHIDDQAYVFNANAGFNDLEKLTGELKAAFNLSPVEAVPEFHPDEFNMMPVSRTLHELFAMVYPEAAAMFDSLQASSKIPYQWQDREDDPALERLAEYLEPLLKQLPAEGKACLGPLLDSWSMGQDSDPFSLYEKLGEEIGGRVQRVEQWNREAAEIFKENERLAADYKKMGTEYAQQQAFLAKQASTQAKIWEELSRTGKSWEEQRDMINGLLEEKRGLLAEVKELRQKLAEREDAGK